MITLCGGEGAGKSTQATKLYDFLKEKNIPCILTKEPGGTRIGLKIRRILLDPESSDLDSKSELLLYLADRAQHFGSVIVPALKDGKIIICDRFIDSTYVYQGVARGMDKDFIDYVHKFILDGFLPDITFILDIDPKKGMTRIDKDLLTGTRSIDESRFDKEKISFHEKIRHGFLDLAKKDTKDRFCIINAENYVEKIFEDIKLKLIEKAIV